MELSVVITWRAASLGGPLLAQGVRGTRSLFNYLVPMLQNKQAEEEETEEGALGRPK